jgi:uncharacterized OsmC-like protein
MTSRVTYLGQLRTASEHVQSGSKVISDAPLDNHGKGEAFSPTDSVANALATCMFTVMAIKARDLNFDFTGSTANVQKIMATSPRRIAMIEVEFNMIQGADSKMRAILEKTAMTCPVMQSLHPDIQKKIIFNWL